MADQSWFKQVQELADEYPEAPVSFQVPDGSAYEVDAEAPPYFYRGVIVLPIKPDA